MRIFQQTRNDVDVVYGFRNRRRVLIGLLPRKGKLIRLREPQELIDKLQEVVNACKELLCTDLDGHADPEATGKCVHCGVPMDEIITREVVVLRCAGCGKYLGDNNDPIKHGPHAGARPTDLKQFCERTGSREPVFIDLPAAKCPGCGVEITVQNAGGYRTFCEKCTEAFPEIPKDGGGYCIEGLYPDFRWVVVVPGTLEECARELSRLMPESKPQYLRVTKAVSWWVKDSGEEVTEDNYYVNLSNTHRLQAKTLEEAYLEAKSVLEEMRRKDATENPT